jgi:hypothetical protein
MPGLRQSDIDIVRGIYNLSRVLKMGMVQLQHVLSGFHAINVSTDTMASELGSGLQDIEQFIRKGEGRKVLRGVGKVIRSQVPGLAPVRAVIAGRKVRKALRGDIENISDPKMKIIADMAMVAGFRSNLDPFYNTKAVDGIIEGLRDIAYGEYTQKLKGGAKIPVQILLAATEKMSAPIMRSLVPNLKAGVFYMYAGQLHERAVKENWSAFKFKDELAKGWDNVDNRMGLLVYDNLNWNRMFKDVLILAQRSLGWNLGSIREFGGALMDVGTVPLRAIKGGDVLTSRMAYSIGAAISYAIQGAILGRVIYGLNAPEDEEGKWPWEYADEGAELLKNYFYPRTGSDNLDGTAERLTMPH